MKKIRKIASFIVILLAFFIITKTENINAEETKSKISIPIYQKIEVVGNINDELNTRVSYLLKRENESYPLPTPNVGNEYKFDIVGESAKKILDFNFLHAGLYEYKIFTKSENVGNYEYDKAVYTIKIYVSNDEKGGLSNQMIVENEEGLKSSKLEFIHKYDEGNTPNNETPPSGKNPETGDKNNMYLWLLISSISLSLIFLVMKKRKKR